MGKSKDDIILQQMEVIRSLTENNLSRMNSDFWGTPKPAAPAKTGGPVSRPYDSPDTAPVGPHTRAAHKPRPPRRKKQFPLPKTSTTWWPSWTPISALAPSSGR